MYPAIRHSVLVPREFELADQQGPHAAGPSTLCASALCVAALLATASAVAQGSRYDAARIDYEIGHYEQAFAVFASLADEGDCDAARLARQMALYGRPLYAIDFAVAPERLAHWQRQPDCPVSVSGQGAERHAP